MAQGAPGFPAPSPVRGAPVVPAHRLGILMVCTGNLNRSPLAERLLAATLAGACPPVTGVHVTSAGTRAVTGTPMDSTAASCLRTLGGEPSGKTAARLTPGLLRGADLVLGATTAHREAAVQLLPVPTLRRAFTLREFARLVSAQDADGLHDPVLRGRALIQGAAQRRGSVPSQGHEDDIADPYEAPTPVAWSRCARLIAEAVEAIACAVTGGLGVGTVRGGDYCF